MLALMARARLALHGLAEAGRVAHTYLTIRLVGAPIVLARHVTASMFAPAHVQRIRHFER